MPAERWKPIPGWEGLYEASDRGRVRRDPYSRGRGARPGRVLSVNTNGSGRQHQWVTLYRAGRGLKIYIHRAVASAFLGSSDLPVVRHLDDNPENNVPSNLAWGTQADNVHDMLLAGRANNGRASITHCPQGHAYDEANTYKTKRGQRACRACGRDRVRRSSMHQKNYGKAA